MGLIRSLNEQGKQGVDAQLPASALSSNWSRAFRSSPVSGFSSPATYTFGLLARHFLKKLCFSACQTCAVCSMRASCLHTS